MQPLSLMVLDGETRSTLGIVRSLGRKGIPIIVGSNNFLGRSNFSKYVKSHFTYPAQNPESAHYAIIKEIERNIESIKPDDRFPSSGCGRTGSDPLGTESRDSHSGNHSFGCCFRRACPETP